MGWMIAARVACIPSVSKSHFFRPVGPLSHLLQIPLVRTLPFHQCRRWRARNILPDSSLIFFLYLFLLKGIKPCVSSPPLRPIPFSWGTDSIFLFLFILPSPPGGTLLLSQSLIPIDRSPCQLIYWGPSPSVSSFCH